MPYNVLNMYYFFWQRCKLIILQNNNNLIDCCDDDNLEDCSIPPTTPNLEEIEDLANFFKIFGDKTRIRILYILKESELCVSCIAKQLDMSSPAVSQQLKILKINRLINSRREGKEVYYSLNDHHIHHILSDGIVHINETFPHK